MIVAELLAGWRSEAEQFRRRGADAAARMLESCAEDLERCLNASDGEAIALEAASLASGYSVAHLRRLIAAGALQNVSMNGRVLVRRGDLPRKPGRHAG